MNALPSTKSKKRIAARFGKTVGAYEANANIQLEIVKRVANLAHGEIGEGQLWCDVGSGSGIFLSHLRILPTGTRFVCLDLAFISLRHALVSRRTMLAVNGDIDFLPIRPETLHGAAAISVIQWSESPETALRNIARMLKPAGTLYFSMFVDGSFAELVELRSRMNLTSTVWLPNANELLKTIERAGFDIMLEEMEDFDRVQYFTDALSILRNLSNIGVTATSGRLLNKTELDELCRNYALTYSKNGNIPLTYRAVIGKVRKKAN